MAAPRRMLRLLQGDVGSGKTVVALIAMAVAVEAGAQAALMAPTEVLARQHLETIAPLAEKAGLRIALLTGREKGRSRKDLLDRLAAGEIDILIGTHALFQSDVVFRDLAFAVIDEQHRFGVHQRLSLQSKGNGSGTDVLVMTATPIPRTLLMTHYGDLDVSRLREKPPGRKPVVTKAIPVDSMEKLIDRLRIQLSEGAQIYWVCPLIESSDKSDLAAAEERHAHLSQLFGKENVGLLHGGMQDRAKDAAMEAFAEGNLKILVATTVIEVGVNVPNANIMVIEHAERFGLAQLHQLRGRVGRGSRESFCMLLYKAPLGEAARQRLDMMEPPRTASSSPRRIWSCAAAARSWARARAARRASASRRCRTSRRCSRPHATMRGSSWRATRSWQVSAARRCGRCSTSSNATRPCAFSARLEASPR